MGRSPTGGGRRKIKRREQRHRFLIACEGEKEVAYFKWLSKRLGGAVFLKPIKKWAAPERVLNLAVSERSADQQAAQESGDADDVYDDVWIVVDVDEYAHLPQALIEADRAGIKSAVSGPCFEVWLILHLADHQAAFNNAKAAKENWAKLVGPTRIVQQEFERTEGYLATAATRADALLDRHARDGTPRHKRNPSSEVGLLIRSVAKATGANVELD
ncbi:MAG: RloB family protein [Propionibacteriaceae bacterium]|nr:RloB family protein [Propionibacteriaceae bacterium]